jgi:hypothetical protein
MGARGRLEESLECYRHALDLEPNFATAHNSLGMALAECGQFEEAMACYRTAFAIEPDYATAHLNLAMTLLMTGDFLPGWAEMEWRWKTPQLRDARRSFDTPLWRGEDAAGKTLLIHGEQGYGDHLQFCRYATLAADRGLRVILEVPGALVRVMRPLRGVQRVIAEGDPLPAFDLHCPMLSLPGAFGTTLASIPATVPYLSVPPEFVAPWGAELTKLAPRRLHVGLVWAGQPRKGSGFAVAAMDALRSIAFERLAPVLDVPGVAFFSLQKDHAAPAGAPVIDLMGNMRDFADTAALVANLDLVISVDTAVAHLAGALGKPVWLLNRHNGCWRWLTGRRDSPWYPAFKLYTQPRRDDWESVVAEMAADLARLATSSL